MPTDIDNTSSILDTLRKMSSKELAVMLLFIVLSVSGAFWVENRYAKLRETQARIEQQQTQLIQLQTQILNVVNALPADIRKEIVERSQAAQALNKNRLEFVPPKE